MEIANDRRLKIGELGRQTELSIKTIRYCEDVSFCGRLEAVTGKGVRSCEG